MIDTELKATAIKLIGFYNDPANAETISRAQYRDDAILWDAIFRHFFERYPNDPVPQPSHYHSGITDPEWDTLFRHMEALRAHDIVLRYLRLNGRTRTHVKEEAA